MKFAVLLFISLLVKGVCAQNSIVHTIKVDPTTRVLTEIFEITTNKDYLLKIDKDQVLDEAHFVVTPSNYRRINGAETDFLLFNSRHVKTEKKRKLKDSHFDILPNGVQTVTVDFYNNYLVNEDAVVYDSTTNNTVRSIIELEGDYSIINYRFSPDVDSKKVIDNNINLKGNLNRLRVEIEFQEKKEQLVKEETKPKSVVEEERFKFNGDVSLFVWDEAKEDGDIISLWIGDVCVAKNLKVSNKKRKFLIKEEMFGETNVLRVRIDNVDEGTIPPNTVLVELVGNEINELIKVNTTKTTSKEIVLVK